MKLHDTDSPAKKTIDSIPNDEATIKKIKDIIDHQFDLEIYLKQREVATIKQEITKAEIILRDLKLAVEKESAAASLPESAHYTRRSALYYHGGSQALMNQSTPPPKKKIPRITEKSRLFGRRNDGVYVSLACPACHRDDFANQQGFLNHCRISHNLEFGPYEQIMLQCGTPVDESEVPIDHPARLRPVLNLVPSVKVTKKLERPSIKVFEEDVDMELENERKKTAQNEKSKTVSSTLAEKPHHQESKTTTAEETTESNSEMNNMKEEVANTEELSKETTVQKETTEEETINDTSSKEEAYNCKSKEGAEESKPATESFAAAMTPSDNLDAGSRFYIKRRILVGNVSKYIAPERRDPSLKQFTHKWMVYIVEPAQSQEKISSFVTCVRFYLHPSYKPHDVIDVTEAPFKLTRLGWGEFPIRIQLFFVDKRRNKTIDLIHHLKLDNTHSGRQLLGGERSIEIELDRNTDFLDTSSAPPPSQETSKEVEPPSLLAVKQKMSLLGGILKECVRKLPIVRAGSHGKILPYTCATSSKMFFKLSIGKRKALEWHRARLLRISTQKRALEINDNVLRIAAEALTTKDVVLWCRTNKYTPVKMDDAEEMKDSALPFGVCRFCGSLRDGHDEAIDDTCPRRPKGWNVRKRNAGISSISSVTNLLKTLEVGWDDPSDDMDIDVDIDEKTITKNEKKYDIKDFDLDTMDVANERSIDWIWSVVGQLRLKSVIANDMMFGRDGNLQGPTSNFDLKSAMNQRITVGNILLRATRSFLKNLVSQTVDICYKEEEGSADKSRKMMVPYHVYQATQQSEEFDFLTNQYMGPEKDSLQ